MRQIRHKKIEADSVSAEGKGMNIIEKMKTSTTLGIVIFTGVMMLLVFIRDWISDAALSYTDLVIRNGFSVLTAYVIGNKVKDTAESWKTQSTDK